MRPEEIKIKQDTDGVSNSKEVQARAWYKNFYVLFAVVAAIIIILVATASNPEQEKAAADAQLKAAQDLKTNGVIDTDFVAFYDKYDARTQVQQQQYWESIKGKNVQWNGTISDVKAGLIDKSSTIVTLQSGFKFFRATLSKDAAIDPSKLNKGDKITIRGKLAGQGSIWELSDATIIK